MAFIEDANISDLMNSEVGSVDLGTRGATIRSAFYSLQTLGALEYMDKLVEKNRRDKQHSIKNGFFNRLLTAECYS